MSKLTAILTLAWLATALALAAAEPVVALDDPLAGATTAVRRGGEFVAGGGWSPRAGTDQLRWELREPVGDGALEFDVRNFDPTRQATSGRAWIVALWETLWASGGSVDRPNHDSIYLRFEQKPGRLMVKISTHGFSFFEKEARFVDRDWDPRRTYRLRIAWRGGVVTIAVDGREVLAWRSPGYDPIDRFRFVTLGSVLGSEARQNETLVGPVYANVRLTTWGKAPPADTSLRITGPARTIPPERRRVVLEDPLRGGAVGQASGGRFLPDGGWTASGAEDRVVWELTRAVRHGAVEVDVRNFDPARQVAGRYGTFLATWEKLWFSGGALDEPGLDCVVWRVRQGWEQLYVELCLRGMSVYNRDHAPVAGGFDPRKTYRLKQEWIDGRVTLAVDGVPFLEWQSPDYDLFDAVRFVSVGGEPRTRSVQGPVFSNLTVTAYELTP
jgi:hypothetical protein